MALWSCVNQLNAGRPEEEVSLLSVHLAYHHFRSRLQNFSRILTIHSPILLSLTKGTQNHSWALREMVWPLLRTFHACSPAWPPQASGERGCSHHHPGKGKLQSWNTGTTWVTARTSDLRFRAAQWGSGNRLLSHGPVLCSLESGCVGSSGLC